MQKIRIDFDNPGLPQHISAVENDSQSRFFQATLYENGKAYTAPEGAAYSIMYRGFGPQNQGWYDTINDGAGKRAACAVSGNVVTCEIARQALQVPGHVSIVLCVTTGKGYMLKSWPIECDCKNDRYDSTTEIESFFYITQVSNADWTQAIQAVEELKNTIDPTLSLSGKAADAKATGDAIGELNESIISVSNGLIHIKLLRDKYVDLNGEIKSFSGWTATDYISIPNDSEINIYSKSQSEYNAFYTKDKVFISSFSVVTGENWISVPNNAKYLACSGETSAFEIKISVSFLASIKKLDDDVSKRKQKSHNMLNAPKSITFVTSRDFKIDKTEGGKKYTLSFSRILKPDDKNTLFSMWNTEDDSIPAVYIFIPSKSMSYTFTAKNVYDILRVYSSDGYSTSEGKTITFEELQLTKSDIVFPYISYGDVILGNFARDTVQIVNEMMGDVPEYWHTAISNAENQFLVNDAKISPHSFRFVFLTDVHWGDNAKKSPVLINKICNDLDISLICFGGDVLTRHKDKATCTEISRDFIKKFDKKLFVTAGNHDNNSDNNKSTSTILTADEMYAALFRKNDYEINYEQSPNHGYFDFAAQKVRFIQIDTGTPFWYDGDKTSIDESRLDLEFDYLYQKISELDATWNVVIFTHEYFLGKFVSSVNSYVTERLNSKVLSKKFEATIAALFVGHTHYDMSTVHNYAGKSVLVICTMQDAASSSQNTESGIPMVIGTDTEQAFDLVQIDFTNRKIYCTRVGAGESREFSY